jgi:molybdopterin-guanine dinucleotide biosynthesis protein A
MRAADLSVARDVTLAVLAGGAGVRMGTPKGLLEIHGELVLSRLLNRLEWVGPKLLVMSPGRVLPPGATLFDQVAWDAEADQGPLRGCLTALETSTSPFVIVVPVDMPGLERAPLLWLVDQIKQQPETAILMMSRKIEGQPEVQIEPMPMAFRRLAARPFLAQRLAQQRRSLQGLAGNDGAGVVPAPAEWPDSFWANLNEPGDLKKFASASAASRERPGSAPVPSPGAPACADRGRSEAG